MSLGTPFGGPPQMCIDRVHGPGFPYIDRRAVLSGVGSTIVSPLGCGLVSTAMADSPALETHDIESHGLSIFGDLAEKADFKAFPYVRPDAPRGGTMSQDVAGTFNSLNAYIRRGDAASGMSLVFDSLMAPNWDERDALYGLVAKSVRMAPDKRILTFALREQARFHDGTPLTAHDVAFSLDILKQKGAPSISQSLRNVESAVARDDHTLVVTLAESRSRELPLIVARQPIFSAAYYAKNGFEDATLEPPLGSGAYRVGNLEQGRYIAFERVADYWAADLPVNVGRHNFDIVRFEYFSDRAVAFEAFKAGAFTLHEELTAATWATGYDFPAVIEGRVVREEIPDANISGIQGWFFNTRRAPFNDPRVREAIGNAFDFNWTNKYLMYDAYKRTQSYFQGSDMAARGLPDAAVLAALEPFRGKVPDEVFGEPYVSPDSDGSGQDRTLLRRASDLLAAAGCVHDGPVLKSADGKPVEIEFLDFSNAFARITQVFVKNLRLLGIDARLRIVDAAQYTQRIDNFDFDVTIQRLAMSFAPGEELRALFGSQSAMVPGSRNTTGISDPVVDALIARSIVASTREELVTTCRSLDRVLRAKRLWVPQWHSSSHRIAYWNVFGHPRRPPRYDPGIISTWWTKGKE
jgi:microcin C transport system substrate-binding protein